MANTIIKGVISYLIIASIFITGNGLAEVGFTFYWYYLIYIPFVICCTLVYHRVDVKIIFVLLAVAIYSLLFFQDGLPLVVKQILNISFSVFVFYNFLVFEEFNFEEIFRKYLTFSKVVLILGFIQVFLFSLDLVNINAGHLFVDCFPFLADSNITFRFQSITQEPSYVAYVFAPVAFFSLYNLFYRVAYGISRKWSFFFVLAYLLTFSLLAYVGVITMLCFIYFKNITYRRLSVVGVLSVAFLILAYVAYLTISPIRMRVEDTMTGFSQGIRNSDTYGGLNYSTYALLTNVFVTKNSLRDQPLTGTGLGTYELAYDRYLPAELKEYLQLNREEANSMALRLLTETGVVGFMVFLFFLFKYRISARPYVSSGQEFLWILNNGILVMIVLFLIRNGNYTMHGRLLFLMLYYYSFQACGKTMGAGVTDAHDR